MQGAEFLVTRAKLHLSPQGGAMGFVSPCSQGGGEAASG